MDPDNLARAIADLQALGASPPPPLPPGSGGGNSGGMSEDWKAAVDRQLGQLHTDVRALLGAIAVLCATIGGLYLYTNAKFEAAAAREAATQVEIAKVAGKIDMLLERTAPAKQ